MIAEYVVVLPTDATGPFVAVGERLDSPDQWLRHIRVVKSWGLNPVLMDARRSDGSVWSMHFENWNPQWKNVVLKYPDRDNGGPFEIVFTDQGRALEVFHAINASWQMWLGGALDRISLTDEQKALLY